MADHLSKEKRSQLMARIRSTDTVPERAVRSILHRLGYRFRLHRKDLPGSPDIVLPRHRTVILSTAASGIGTKAVPWPASWLPARP